MTGLDLTSDRLRRLVDETPTDQLAALAAEQDGGTDGVLDLVFEVYRMSFLPERAADARADFLFEISCVDGTRPYFLSVADATCRVGRGAVAEPTATIALELADFLQMSYGKTNGGVLAMSGRLEVSGDVFAAISFGEWFEPPWDEE